MVDSFLEIITESGNQKFYKSIEVQSVTNAIDVIEESMESVVAFFVGRY